MGERKYLLALAVWFVAVLLISNIVSTKIVDLGSIAGFGLVFDGGTLLFPLSYIFGDILTEVYGFKRSRKVIWLGFGAAALMAVMIILIGALPAASDWPFQQDYMNVLGYAPRIVLASLIAYLIGEFSNAAILAKMKVRQKGKQFGLRAIVSTLVGQGIDTILFVIIAFAGVLPRTVVRAIILANYAFKVLIELVLLPVTTKLVIRLKTAEKVDVYDDTITLI